MSDLVNSAAQPCQFLGNSSCSFKKDALAAISIASPGIIV